MSKSRLRARAGLTCAIALVCASAVACDSVLDIQDPKIRPGDGGEPSASGGTSTAKAGSAATPEGGGAGEGGGGTGGTAAIFGGAGAGSGGEGGDLTVTPMGCETDSVRCTNLNPEVCNEFGQWVPNVAEAAGECAVQCSEGRCVECLPDEKRCTACEDGAASCNTNQPQRCVDGAWANDGVSCAGYCDAGSCVMPPSCPSIAQEQTTCTNGNNVESCCKSLLVPGGTFIRDYDKDEYPEALYPATVRPFYLDKFEVTVGRMRTFANAYDHIKLKDGQGKSSYLVGDTGWDEELPLPLDREELVAALKCGDDAATWSDNASFNNRMPANCVTFSVAYAFCIWDGGRLPTQAEWNFAASGGGEQRVYPWSDPPNSSIVSTDHANYDSTGATGVGLKVAGDGKWGHADLGGNVYEWMLDFYADPLETCVDCVDLTPASERVIRGGAYSTPSDLVKSAFRISQSQNDAEPFTGFRCAREPVQQGAQKFRR